MTISHYYIATFELFVLRISHFEYKVSHFSVRVRTLTQRVRSQTHSPLASSALSDASLVILSTSSLWIISVYCYPLSLSSYDSRRPLVLLKVPI
jgi:hypothetical protein